ncbi:hypothetical protein Sjap_022907 [Stephania japonica]|uniref:Ribulose bisphosphate carboxylase/oxygenase activase AAA helical domain-containing protein n=1 Tax=Stephania japonica TaxID=461633 RepID=A0AAP0HVC8_9MAGN
MSLRNCYCKADLFVLLDRLFFHSHTTRSLKFALNPHRTTTRTSTSPKPKASYHSFAKRFSLQVARCSPRPNAEESGGGSGSGSDAKRKISEQSSWEAKDAEGKDYLYRLGKEADNMNVAVGARAGIIDDLFVGNFLGRDSDIVFDYRQKVTRSFEYLQGDYYIAPVFLVRIKLVSSCKSKATILTCALKFIDMGIVCHIVKNYIAHLLDVKVPLILGIWGGKGQGKSFQTELIFQAMGVEPIIMSAGELESERAGEPGKLIRERYRAASQVVQNQVRSLLTFISNICRQPTQEDIINIVVRMYEKDGISRGAVVGIVETFPNQALDFYGALRSRTYDRSISKWVEDIGGFENLGQTLLKRKKDNKLPTFIPPKQTVEALLESGHSLIKEQQLIMETRLSKEYMKNIDD